MIMNHCIMYLYNTAYKSGITITVYHMVGNFCGVQSFVNFVELSYPQKFAKILAI